MTTVDNDAITYFDGLGRHCLPALQVAWDKASSGKFSKGSIYKGLCRDFGEIGETSPTARLFDLWAVGVERGEIERPARIVSNVEDTAAEPDHAEPCEAATTTTSASKSQQSLKAALKQLTDEIYEKMLTGLRQTAREVAIDKLREMLDELEGGAA